MFPSVKLVKTDKVHTFSEGLCTRTVLETHDFAVAVLVDGYCNTGYGVSRTEMQNEQYFYQRMNVVKGNFPISFKME